ncbi:bystin-like [Papaver somniferum]|uniref:bystin-like n=1 Tax=Papaver somniferum TaxID=3469 RepID=UPI000E701E09|nr:bystin-like [Papaver somniferum]
MEAGKMINRALRKHKQPVLTNEPFSAVPKKRSRCDTIKHHQKEMKMSSSLTSKILKAASFQQKEIEDEARKEDPFFSIPEKVGGVSEDSDSDSDERFGSLDELSETESQYNDYEVEVDEEQMEILEHFMSKAPGTQLTLSDRVINRIKNAESVSAEQQHQPLPQMGKDIYKRIGEYLSRYSSGKLPKAFLSIPRSSHWEDALYLTEPEKWSANAMYQATNIFASNMSPKNAQRFYSSVLLPRVREDIRKNRKLHFALYQALKKSVYKPEAFHKGVLFPLCKSGTCNLREAVIIGSIIQKVSIPPKHSSAALMKLAEMEYCGTTSYFIKLILDKKYALPYCALDAVVAHFMRFLEDSRVMPVIWHQSLLTLVQRYKYELTKENKENLERLIQHQKHYMVTEDIRRELRNSRNRGEKEDPMTISSPYRNTPVEEDRFNYPEVCMEED